MQYHIISVEVSLVRGVWKQNPTPKGPAIAPNCLLEAPWSIIPKIGRVISGDVCPRILMQNNAKTPHARAAFHLATQRHGVAPTVKTRMKDKCARTLEFPFSATRVENTANSAPD